MSDIPATLFIKSRSNITALKQPKEIGCYSRKSKSIISTSSSPTDSNSITAVKSKISVHYEASYLINDHSYLNYYYLPDADVDKRVIKLSTGFTKFKNATPINDCSLAGLLKTIIELEKEKKKKGSSSNRYGNYDIITFRGIIKSLIMCFNNNPYNNPINLQICTFDNQIFIKNIDESHSNKETELTKENLFSQKILYSGYKFESCCTLPEPLPYVTREKLEKRYKKVASNDEQYISIVKTGISSFKLILAGEVDAVYDFYEDSPQNGDNLKHYLELKSSTQIINQNQGRKFENKLFGAWLQCFLMGIPRITYGYRDDEFNLIAVEEFQTVEIPELFKNQNSNLQAYFVDCIKWYGCVMEWLMANIDKSQDDNYYRLWYQDNHLKLVKIASDSEEISKYKYNEIVSKEFREWRKPRSE
ncbi:related to Protein RAI1 [Saccharomycodes ludwigii]|uniref:Decapping nuclease n=1 Tax=Saccharomycodes ludwigii TaxID=36035 RepID=A0A376B5X5_9ASCO|nr:related to Protein RAI1 [Saccharomycodes ludwigii]